MGSVMGFKTVSPENGMLAMLLDPRYRMATEAPVFRSRRRHSRDASEPKATAQKQCEADMPPAKFVARHQAATTKLAPLLLTKPIQKTECAVENDDFVLGHALKMAGNRNAPWD